MKKIGFFVYLLIIFLSFNQVEARNRFGLLVDIGKVDPQGGVPSNGGKTSYSLAGEYNLGKPGRHFNISFALGLKVQRLPLKPYGYFYFIEFQGMRTAYYKGDWTSGIFYFKMLMDKEKLIPFVEVGAGLYYMDFETPNMWISSMYQLNSQEITKYYPGLYLAGGLELSLGHFSVFGGLEYHRIPIKPALEIPNLRDIKLTKILNPKLGVGYRF